MWVALPQLNYEQFKLRPVVHEFVGKKLAFAFGFFLDVLINIHINRTMQVQVGIRGKAKILKIYFHLQNFKWPHRSKPNKIFLPK